MRFKSKVVTYRLFLLISAAAFIAVGGQAQDKKPNILVIMGDDIGVTNISVYSHGMMGYQTPNIDRVAKEGALFTDYYAQQSCTAGRSAFITGQSPFRTGPPWSFTACHLPCPGCDWKSGLATCLCLVVEKVPQLIHNSAGLPIRTVSNRGDRTGVLITPTSLVLELRYWSGSGSSNHRPHELLSRNP
jgi:hypothetical protein